MKDTNTNKNTNKNINDFLIQHKLNITKSRQDILTLFLKSKVAISSAYIDNKIKNSDRVTIYRTIQTFIKKGIIHSIPTNDDHIKFALCKDLCDEGNHHDNHIHFTCQKCAETFCIENTTIPKIKLPDYFVLQETQLLAKGICNVCSQKSSK